MTVRLDPALASADADALLALIREAGPYEVYVQAPVAEGLGAGLVRRHDALMHYVKERYASGEATSMGDIAARTNLFRGVFAEGSQIHHEGAASILYRHPPFLEAARTLTGLPLVVPDMLYVNALLPGQELAVHTDTPEYLGISKAQVPEWFCVVMRHSQLFEDWRVRIAGGVSFFRPPARGGAFILYPEGPTGPREAVALRHNTSVMLDADAIFHGVERVGGPDVPAPPVRPGMTLGAADDGWELREGDQLVARYGADEVRISIQWKAHCYANEEARARREGHLDDLTVEGAVATLLEDLRARGVLSGPRPDDTALGLLLIETYVDFPS